MGTRNPEFRTITVSVEFEVRGEIQGLYFLKYCREEANKLGIYGWVKHGRRGSIVGIIQGPKTRVEQMIYWLSNRGSPGSRIDECFLNNYQYISKPEYRNFNQQRERLDKIKKEKKRKKKKNPTISIWQKSL